MQNDFFCWGNASESSTSSNHTLHSVGEPSAKRPKLQLGAPSLNVIPRVKVNSDVTDLLRDDDKEECPDGSTIEVDTGHGLTGKIGEYVLLEGAWGIGEHGVVVTAFVLY